MKIAEIRAVINRLNWTRNDLSGATSGEFQRMDVTARLAPWIAECKALVIPSRFVRDVENQQHAIERAEAMAARWQELQAPQECPPPTPAADTKTLCFGQTSSDNPLSRGLRDQQSHQRRTSMSVNKTTLIGNLGADPETRTLPSGKKVAAFSLATTDKWKDRTTGEAKEKTEWHRVVVYDRLAEVVGEYAKKGRQVYVEGKLRNRRWTDDAQVEHFMTEIVGYEFQLLGAKPAGGETPAAPRQPGPSTGFDDMDDDIPF
jgi:single-strand DNA-binding protein